MRSHCRSTPRDAGARQRREDVAIRQDDETGLERRDDLLFQAVGEVGGVEQHEGQLVERVARLGELDGRLHQRRAGPPGLDDAVALDLEPLAQQLDLRAAADAVGALDRDQLARVAVDAADRGCRGRSSGPPGRLRWRRRRAGRARQTTGSSSVISTWRVLNVLRDDAA